MIKIYTRTKFGDGVLVGLERFTEKGMKSYVDEEWGSIEQVRAWLDGEMGDTPNRLIVKLDNPVPEGLFKVIYDNRLAFYRHDVATVEEVQ